MMVEIAPNATIGQWIFIRASRDYVLDGNLDLVIEGKPPQAFEPRRLHGAAQRRARRQSVERNKGLKLIGVYVVDKTKPLATPAPASQ